MGGAPEIIRMEAVASYTRWQSLGPQIRGFACPVLTAHHDHVVQRQTPIGHTICKAPAFTSNNSANWSVIAPPSCSASVMVTAR